MSTEYSEGEQAPASPANQSQKGPLCGTLRFKEQNKNNQCIQKNTDSVYLLPATCTLQTAPYTCTFKKTKNTQEYTLILATCTLQTAPCTTAHRGTEYKIISVSKKIHCVSDTGHMHTANGTLHVLLHCYVIKRMSLQMYVWNGCYVAQTQSQNIGS